MLNQYHIRDTCRQILSGAVRYYFIKFHPKRAFGRSFTNSRNIEFSADYPNVRPLYNNTLKSCFLAPFCESPHITTTERLAYCVKNQQKRSKLFTPFQILHAPTQQYSLKPTRLKPLVQPTRYVINPASK